MATFKAIIRKDKQRSDKTWNVVIRFTHDRKVRYISTSMYATKADVTSSYKLKNRNIIDECEDLIRTYKRRITALNLDLVDVDIDVIVNFMKQKDDNHGINFTEFAENWMARHPEIKGMKNYKTSLNAFKTFLGRENILCDDITVSRMEDFARSLAYHPRAQSLYTNAIVRMFNEARKQYNDEDNNIIRIKQSLSKFKPIRQNVAEKRALSLEDIRRLFALPYDNKRHNGLISRHDLSLDCYRLSFCLLGMNSADLFAAERYEDGYIIYNREKTKDRRRDHAGIEVRVPDVIRPIFERYRGKDRVFNFYERFSGKDELNRAINIGLKSVGKELGIEGLQLYSARHTMATLAANDLQIDRWTVGLMLNHVDNMTSVTELYIKKDYTSINEANTRLMEYVFET